MPECYLGFDYSLNKIGVAVGQSLTSSATPLSTLTSPHKKPDWQAISILIQQWKPAALIVGLPMNMDGSAQNTTELAKSFGKQLNQRYNLPIHYVDERLSSREASHILGYAGHTSPLRQAGHGKKIKKNKRQGHDIDKVAAQLILQSWLNSL